METIMENPMVIIAMGGLVTILTTFAKKFKINPNYGAVLIALVVGILAVLFQKLLKIETQEQVVQWILSIYATSTIIYNVIIKFLLK